MEGGGGVEEGMEGKEVPFAASCFTKGVCWMSSAILRESERRF